jgi:hypothetical protein
MNKRIQELAEQATTYANFDRERFAELIVRECSQLDFYITGEVTMHGDAVISNLIKKHFGVEE